MTWDRVWCETADGVCHGPWVGFSQGKPIAMGEYDHGRSTGVEFTMNAGEEGPIVLRHRSDGKLHGDVIGWYATGNVWFYQRYRAGVQHGAMFEWAKDGLVRKAQQFEDGQAVAFHIAVPEGLVDRLQGRFPEFPPHIAKEQFAAWTAERLCTYHD